VASVYARGNVLWCRLKDESGAWVRKPTPYRSGDERNAQRYADAAQAAVDERRAGGATVAPMTFETYAEQWLTIRREMNAATSARFAATGKAGCSIATTRPTRAGCGSMCSRRSAR